jgi:serine/threonine-protein kinase RsbW
VGQGGNGSGEIEAAEAAGRLGAGKTAVHLDRLRRTTSRLLTAPTPAEVARAVTDSLAESDRGGILWCQVWVVEGDLLTLANEVPPPSNEAPRSVRLDGRAILAECVRARAPAFANWSPADVEGPEGSGPPAMPPHATAIIPVLFGARCFGALVVGYPPQQEVDSEERGFLASLAEQAAQALDRAELYEENAALAQANDFLAESAQILAEASDFADTLDRLARLSLTALGDICVIDLRDEEGLAERMVARHRNPSQQPLLDRLSQDHGPDPRDRDPVLDVVRDSRTSWSPEVTDEFLRESARDNPHFDALKALQIRSYVAVPLVTSGETLGSFTILSAGRAFTPADVSLAEKLAQQVAALAYNARRYDATLQTSQILQHSLLPRKIPIVAGLQIDTRYLPATRGLEVGGDFYDLVVLPSSRAGFMIGDVAGHNRDAAAVMGQLRSAARALSGQVRSPASLIIALQWSWDLLGFDRIATALFGRLDQTNGDLVLASAGHPPPLLIEPHRARFLPIIPSAPLGVPASEADNWEGRLEPGHTLLLYTDGVLDERGERSAGGMDRLAEVAADGDIHPSAVCERVVAMLPPHRSDDVALLALRIAD